MRSLSVQRSHVPPQACNPPRPTADSRIIQKTEYAAEDLPSLRHCMSAGEHLSDEMLSAWRERFGMDVYEAIGYIDSGFTPFAAP